ncbi:MAG: hypothetical protein AAGJ31_02405, partial [Verrucomicrobiota bacterium]
MVLRKVLSLIRWAVLGVLSLVSGLAGDLSFSSDGRWSVATRWENQWPMDWHHADADREESIGEWTIYSGAIELPTGTLLVQDQERVCENGLTEVLRRWSWTGEEALSHVTLSVRTQIDVADARPFLPGISYYDNPAGQSIDGSVIPVIGTEVGDKGFYEEHRYPMPFAAVEGKQDGQYVTAALHALPTPLFGGNRSDQWWSIGLERVAQDRVELALLSGPVASNGRNGIIKGKQKEWFDYHDTTLTLRAGEVVEKTFFLQRASPTTRGNGFRTAIWATLEMADLETHDVYPAYRTVLQKKVGDSLRRWREGDGFAGIHFRPDESKTWFEFGWAAQSEAFAYPMITMG